MAEKTHGNDRAGEAATPAEKPRESDRNAPPAVDAPTEIGGPRGPEPTRYGDWEKNGRCIDF